MLLSVILLNVIAVNVLMLVVITLNDVLSVVVSFECKRLPQDNLVD